MISFLFNRFDFIIRFLYCRVPFLSKFVNKLRFWNAYSSDYSTLDKKFENIKLRLSNQKFKIKDKVILELGPGNSYINAYNFILNGAKKVYLVDKYPRYNNSKRQQTYIENEIEYIVKKYNVTRDDFDKTIDGKISVIVDDLVNVDVNDVDFILSISVLEHVKNISGNISKMKHVLKPKGMMYHSIDMRDHYNFNNPFLFYKYSKNVWEKFLTKEGLSYTNRWRFNDFVDEFESNNFKVEVIDKKKCSIGSFKIERSFKDRDDLDIGTASFLLSR